MLDASSQLESSFTNTNLADLGDFDTCLAIQAKVSFGRVIGKHCMGTLYADLPQNKIVMNTSQESHPNRSIHKPFYSSLCIPDTCRGEEASRVFNMVLALSEIPVFIEVSESNCQTLESINPNLDILATVAM